MSEAIRIVQIIPADGWEALYTDPAGDVTIIEDVVAFALVEESDGYRYVTPLVPDDRLIEFASNAANFKRIMRKSVSELHE